MRQLVLVFSSFVMLLLLPLRLFLLLPRIYKKKESLIRIMERFGISNIPKPIGDLIWIHGASVGESLAALTLIEGMNNSSGPLDNYKFLLTTNTLAAANALQGKLPKNCIHQFLPIDNPIFAYIFLKHWKPKLSIFIESELWPCIIGITHYFCPLLLFNARMSDKSLLMWMKFKWFLQGVCSNFAEVLVQSDVDLKKFNELGISEVSKIRNLGNIKFANKALSYDQGALKDLTLYFEGRKVVVLGSTHPEDAQVICKPIKNLRQKEQKLSFIMCLRHPFDSLESVIQICEKNNLTYQLRSKTKTPSFDTDIYIIDNFTELGLFYNLADIVFIGGSFAHGGHNLLEPAHFNKAIIVGPDMGNFREITKNMIEEGAAIQIKNELDLSKRLDHLLSKAGSEDLKNYQINSGNFIRKKKDVLKGYLEAIIKYVNYCE